ncbi:major facilitator superfamily domain-containing protein [Armillaria luteobubalina]|uniref:Major facilitator superfamily domain-containing protein n=1 Tax=Armillaria luteobubalina TaxID=153913 RepID=A0AA39ULW9_9AGAR|nr:major facilitator superfamily domain-containing protein [Armillaria luteobubalina]
MVSAAKANINVVSETVSSDLFELPKAMAESRYQAFFPHSFPTGLETSTPPDLDRQKPPLIVFAPSSSPQSSPTPPALSTSPKRSTILRSEPFQIQGLTLLKRQHSTTPDSPSKHLRTESPPSGSRDAIGASPLADVVARRQPTTVPTAPQRKPLLTLTQLFASAKTSPKGKERTFSKPRPPAKAPVPIVPEEPVSADLDIAMDVDVDLISPAKSLSSIADEDSDDDNEGGLPHFTYDPGAFRPPFASTQLHGSQLGYNSHVDTGLVGQQYSWLTTVFYLTYMCFKFPSNIILQRWRMGKTLSIYMICWGVVVLCIGFSKNFKHLIALRALQGFFECCISPGLILIIGSWYTRREHSSRSLVIQSANAGSGVIADLTLYDIGTLEYNGRHPGLAIYVLLSRTPHYRSRAPLFEEKRMANTRILENQSGHDRTGTKVWKWDQARECLVDPCFYFAGINAFLSSVPNGGLTTFGSIINTSFGFTSLQVILYTIPRSMTSVVIFVIVGLVTSKWKNLRLYIMAFATIPPFIGFLGMALIETSPSTKWTKWGMYYMTVPFVLSLFLAWSLIPSNFPGRTKRTQTSSFTFIGYYVGNMCGSQIFKTKDAPTYTPGVIGCSICFGVEFLIIVAWWTTLVLRNRRRDKAMLTDGLTQEEREMQGKINGESDMTDFENPHVSPQLSPRLYVQPSLRLIVPVYSLTQDVGLNNFIYDGSDTSCNEYTESSAFAVTFSSRKIYHLSILVSSRRSL